MTEKTAGADMRQHYDFAHRLFADFVLTRPRERVERLLRGTVVDFFLEDLWDEAGAEPDELDLDDPARVLPTGEQLVIDEHHDGVLVDLPPPESATEAYFCLVTFGSRVRFFTLERTDATDGEAGDPMLCEWDLSEGRRHLNYGEVPTADRAAFVQSVGSLLSE